MKLSVIDWFLCFVQYLFKAWRASFGTFSLVIVLSFSLIFWSREFSVSSTRAVRVQSCGCDSFSLFFAFILLDPIHISHSSCFLHAIPLTVPHSWHRAIDIWVLLKTKLFPPTLIDERIDWRRASSTRALNSTLCCLRAYWCIGVRCGATQAALNDCSNSVVYIDFFSSFHYLYG